MTSIDIDCAGSPVTMRSSKPFSRLEAALEQPRCSSATWATPKQPGSFLAASSAPALDVSQALASWHSDAWHTAASALSLRMQHAPRALQGGGRMSHQAAQHQAAAELAIHSGDGMDYVNHASNSPSAVASGKKTPLW